MEDVPQNILLIVQDDLASKVNEFDIFLLKKEEEYIDITKKKHTHTHTHKYIKFYSCRVSYFEIIAL